MKPAALVAIVATLLFPLLLAGLVDARPAPPILSTQNDSPAGPFDCPGCSSHLPSSFLLYSLSLGLTN